MGLFRLIKCIRTAISDKYLYISTSIKAWDKTNVSSRDRDKLKEIFKNPISCFIIIGTIKTIVVLLIIIECITEEKIVHKGIYGGEDISSINFSNQERLNMLIVNLKSEILAFVLDNEGKLVNNSTLMLTIAVFIKLIEIVVSMVFLIIPVYLIFSK